MYVVTSILECDNADASLLERADAALWADIQAAQEIVPYLVESRVRKAVSWYPGGCHRNVSQQHSRYSRIFYQATEAVSAYYHFRCISSNGVM